MSHRASLTLGIIILVSAASYFYWREQAEQKIDRQLDLFVETVEFKRISLESPDQTAQACRDLFATSVEIEAPHPAPSGSFSEDNIVDQLNHFHRYLAFFQFEESRRKMTIDGDTARASLHGTMTAGNPQWRESLTGTIEFAFENGENGWEIISLLVDTD